MQAGASTRLLLQMGAPLACTPRRISCTPRCISCTPQCARTPWHFSCTPQQAQSPRTQFPSPLPSPLCPCAPHSPHQLFWAPLAVWGGGTLSCVTPPCASSPPPFTASPLLPLLSSHTRGGGTAQSPLGHGCSPNPPQPPALWGWLPLSPPPLSVGLSRGGRRRRRSGGGCGGCTGAGGEDGSAEAWQEESGEDTARGGSRSPNPNSPKIHPRASPATRERRGCERHRFVGSFHMLYFSSQNN